MHVPGPLLSLQARVSAAQVARSRESTQPASPTQHTERRQQQPQQQQRQVDAASLPAHLAAAMSAATHGQACSRAHYHQPVHQHATTTTRLAAWLKSGGALCAQDRLLGGPVGTPPQLRTASAPAGAEPAAEGAAVPAEGDAATTSEDGNDKTVRKDGRLEGKKSIGYLTTPATCCYAAAAKCNHHCAVTCHGGCTAPAVHLRFV